MAKIILELQGGLGNQLFQLATTVKLSEACGHSILVDKSHYLRKKTRQYELGPLERDLRIKSSYLARFIYRNTSRFTEKEEFEPFSFDPNASKNYSIKGYFQNPSSVYKECDKLANTLSEYFKRNFTISKGSCCDFQHVGIHIRRGDYENIEINTLNFGVLNDQYFLSAMEYFDSRNVHYIFYSETNDLPITKYLPSSLKYSINSDNGMSALMLLGEMSQNDHFVMSNSSLSWWAAYLIKYRKSDATIISPETWFRKFPKSNSLINSSWITMKALWK